MAPDRASLLARLKSALPSRWFPDATPVLDGLLAGLASSWIVLFQALAYLQAQGRIATATDLLLDIAATDYFGADFRRAANEPDTAFRARLRHEFGRDHATRAALVTAVSEITGRAPSVFEFARPTDTGAYGIALAYGGGGIAGAGAWGSLALPYQALVTTQGAAAAAIARALPTAVIAWTRTV